MTRISVSRRGFLTAAASLAVTLRQSSTEALRAQPPRTSLILLGTGGGPRPRTASSAAAQVIVSQGTAYVIDCGDGVARQMAFAGVPLASIRHVFLTHQHSDHNADYGNLLWLAWTAGLRTRVDTWGPPPLQRMTELFFAMNQSTSMYASRTRDARRWCRWCIHTRSRRPARCSATSA